MIYRESSPCFSPAMQSSVRLSDRDAAEAVRIRIDCKYLLGLELSDSGFDYSILSRFRDRLIEGHAEMSLLDRFLDKCKSLGMLRDRSDMRTDSTHVVASIRNMNRSELVGETLRATLNVLSTADPQWMAANVDASWYLKYARRFGYPRETLSKEAIIAAAEGIGRDGIALLARIWSEEHLFICAACPRSRSCASAGSRSSGLTMASYAGVTPGTFLPSRCASTLHLMSRLGTA